MTSPTSYMPGAGQRPPRRFSTGAIVGALALGVLLGGGGGYLGATQLGGEAPVETAAFEPAPTDAATSAPASSPVAPAPDDRRFAMGKVWTFDNGAATTTVLRYQANVDDGSEDGETFNAIEIRSCVTKTADAAARWSDTPWTLEDAEGVSYNSHVNGVLRGEYPFDKLVEPGRCIKGWAVFAMPKGVKPILAVYEGAGNVGRPAEWKIG